MARSHTLPEEEGHNFLASVSDLMASLLFVFILLLLLFALQLQQATAKKVETVEQLTSARKSRDHLLTELETRLVGRGLKVVIDRDEGVLRLTEDFINFPRGGADPISDHVENARILADVLADVVPCFTAARSETCHDERLKNMGSEAASNLNVLMIEGHTDRSRFHGAKGEDLNVELSTQRAANIYRVLTRRQSILETLKNSADERLLSVSGYSSWRLLTPDAPYAERNRRIDLRFIMEPPAPNEGLPAPARKTGSRLGEGDDGG